MPPPRSATNPTPSKCHIPIHRLPTEERERRREAPHSGTFTVHPRRTIQRAANAQWPYNKAATRPIRAEFGLPKTRPLKY